LAPARGPSTSWDRGAGRDCIVKYFDQLLADTVTLRDMYAFYRPRTAGPALQKRHRLFDRHFSGQHVLVYEIAHDIQLLGGDMIATAREDITTRTLIPRDPDGFEEHSDPVICLLKAHQIVLVVSRATIHELSLFGIAEPSISNVVSTNEAHVWALVRFMALESQTSASHPAWAASV